MNPPDLKELRHLALHAELARPLAHECNNFLNNLLLQLAILQGSQGGSLPVEWANIKREGKKLADLFQQWQRSRKFEDSATIDLRELLQQVIDDVRAESPARRILIEGEQGPITFTGPAGQLERLLHLLLGHAISVIEKTGAPAPTLIISLKREKERIRLELRSSGAAPMGWEDFGDVPPSKLSTLSLIVLTCKSLVQRLDGAMQVEQDANGNAALVVSLLPSIS
jgi:signal transduction histidine kinase